MANNTHFAVFKRSGFWLIPAEILIYARLKLFGNKSAIFPAALWSMEDPAICNNNQDSQQLTSDWNELWDNRYILHWILSKE